MVAKFGILVIYVSLSRMKCWTRLILSFIVLGVLSAASVSIAAQENELREPVVVAKYGKQPRAAVDGIGNFFVVYGEENSIFFCVSKDGGLTYSLPTKVGELAGLVLGHRSGPQIATTGRYISISAVSELDGNLVAWHSADSGITWSAPVKINDPDSSAREGLHAMSAGLEEDVFAVWLDLREKGTKLFGSRSADGGKGWSKNFLIYESPDGTICECCQPAVTSDAKGNLYVMWRNLISGSRDIYMSVSTDRARSFSHAQKLGFGTWVLNGCAMDGGSIAVDDSGKLLTMWRRENKIFEATPGVQEKFFGEGMQPVVAFGPGGWYKVWMSGKSILTSTPSKPVLMRGYGTFPSIASGPSGKPPVIAVFENSNGVMSMRLDEQ